MLHVFSIPMRHRFRGLTVREGIVFEGACGWAEWSPFCDYSGVELVPWLAAAQEAAHAGWPTPVRDEVPINATIPALDPDAAHQLAEATHAHTIKVKVAERGQHFADDIARLEAVRDAAPTAAIRIDANGAWSVDDALGHVRDLARFDLEYVEQPCPTADDLARLRRELARRGLDIRIAADESIRRSGDPERVARLAAADIAVLKVQPLGGVRRCLQLAEDLAMPVVVSSAVESSIGLAAGVALAAALPELPFACGLATTSLLTGDLAAEPLVPSAGVLPVCRPAAAPELLDRYAARVDRATFWRDRYHHTKESM